VDLAKYRNLFLEEATEHLAEISRALLELEKDPSRGEALDLVFRMAHSIKGMAASLDYAPITELAHALEDRMDVFRSAGRVDPTDGLPLLFRGLEGLERMVAAVREAGESPPADPALLALLRGAPQAARDPADRDPNDSSAGPRSGNVPKKAHRRP
jgi:two-component system, chemotaxis family, sensor kinase CheA